MINNSNKKRLIFRIVIVKVSYLKMYVMDTPMSVGSR